MIRHPLTELDHAWIEFHAARRAWQAVTDHVPINAQDDYQGFVEFRALRSAARHLARLVYRTALLPTEPLE